jgi:hypothetical protein
MFDFLPVVLAVLMTIPGGPESAAVNRNRPAITRTARELLTAPDRTVRTTDRGVQNLLSRGMSRSPTFTALVRALDQTDVIVYIEMNRGLPPTVAGRLLFATVAREGTRYLRVQISNGATMNMQVAAIAHELQHALEVANEPDVRDEAGLERLYERIGRRGAVERSYDTLEAQRAGQRVFLEVQG